MIDSIKTFLFVGSILTGTFLLFLGFFAGMWWERGSQHVSEPKMARPAYIQDFDRFCERTDWCAGYLGHPGACFESEEGERPTGT